MTSSNLPPKHYHPGAGCQRILDSARVLNTIGLKKGQSFLDVGCGNGYMSLAASEVVGSEGRIYAIDINAESIDMLKGEVKSRKIKNIEAIVADVTGKTPLAGESIEVCLMANVMHGFVENKEVPGVMKETSRILKYGAIIAVVDFKVDADLPRPPLNIRLSPEKVTAIITPYHYRQKQVVEVGTYHYAVIFAKE